MIAIQTLELGPLDLKTLSDHDLATLWAALPQKPETSKEAFALLQVESEGYRRSKKVYTRSVITKAKAGNIDYFQITRNTPEGPVTFDIPPSELEELEMLYGSHETYCGE